MSRSRKLFYLILLMSFAILGGCVNNWIKESSDKDIVAFYFSKNNNPDFKDDRDIPDTARQYNGLIEGTSITVFMPPFVSDRSSMVANFVTTAETVKVNNEIQVSGATPNDFSAKAVVTYKAIAEDGSSKDYSVRVMTPPDRRVIFFRLLKSVDSCLSEDAEGVIDSSRNEIHIYRNEADVDCERVIPSFKLSSDSYWKVDGAMQQSGVTAVDFKGYNFRKYTFVTADGKNIDWKVYLKTRSHEAEIEEFYVEYKVDSLEYKQVFEGVVNYSDVNVYLGDEINLHSFLRFASMPVVKVSGGASYDTQIFVESRGDAVTLYKIIVTSSNGQNVKHYNVNFSYALPAIFSFKLQPYPSPGRSNDIEQDIPGYIYERNENGGLDKTSSIHLKFPLGMEIRNHYVATFSFAGREVHSSAFYGANGVSGNKEVINRHTPVEFFPPLKYRVSYGGEENGHYVDYDIKMDNEAPRLAGANALLAGVENIEKGYANLYIKPQRYYECEDVPALKAESRCGNAGDASVIAYDDVTEYNFLECGIFYSYKDNINTLEDIKGDGQGRKGNGKLLGDYYSFSNPRLPFPRGSSEYILPKGECAFSARLMQKGDIYFNMIIRDRAGHETAFSDKAVKVELNDYVPPQIKDPELRIFPKDLNGTVELQWLINDAPTPDHAVYYSDVDMNVKDEIEEKGVIVEDYRVFNCEDYKVFDCKNNKVFNCDDRVKLCSYQFSTLKYSDCLDGCFFYVMAKDSFGNTVAYEGAEFITESFEAKLEKEVDFSANTPGSDETGYFIGMDAEKAFNKRAADGHSDCLIFPLEVRTLRQGESYDNAMNGEYGFQILNVTPEGDVSLNAYSERLKKDLLPLSLRDDLQKKFGFAKARLGVFRAAFTDYVEPVESAVLLVGDKRNRYVKLRIMDTRNNLDCDLMECVREVTEGVVDPVADKYHYLDNGPLLQLSNGNILASYAVQNEKYGASWRRNVLRIYDFDEQDWNEAGLGEFKEVRNHSLNIHPEGVATFPTYGTEIHPVPLAAGTFYKRSKSNGRVETGIIALHTEGFFTFSVGDRTDGSKYLAPRHNHILMAKFFSNEGVFIKEEKLDSGIIANQYPSIANLDNGDLMIAYPASRFVDDGGGKFKVKTDIKIAIYLPDEGRFLVKDKIIKTIEKGFAGKGGSSYLDALVNPVTQGNFAELVPGGVSSVALPGKVVIAYRDPSDGNKGKFVVFNNKGEPISDEVAFSDLPVANDVYYIRDPLYSFEGFDSDWREYAEISYRRTNFARITVGAFANGKVLISFIPDAPDDIGKETVKMVIVK